MGIAGHSLALNSSELAVTTGGLALLALFLLLTGLILAWGAGIGWALAALATLYLSHLYFSGPIIGLEVSLVGVGLLLVGELSQWSLDSRLSWRFERSLCASRAIGLILLVAIALGVALLAQLASEVRVAGSLGTVASGTAAVVGLLALIATVGLWRVGSRP